MLPLVKGLVTAARCGSALMRQALTEATFAFRAEALSISIDNAQPCCFGRTLRCAPPRLPAAVGHLTLLADTIPLAKSNANTSTCLRVDAVKGSRSSSSKAHRFINAPFHLPA